nr:turripeptide Lol9.1-like [Cherax quadricarinatus]XP_053648609.1 turripeptide Lol9.1-like [Cherax quadricarinatus]
MVSRVFLVLVVLQVLYISVQARNPQQCPLECRLKFKPVCDSTGNVYSSKCVLDVAICKDPSIQPGVCDVRVQQRS